MTKLFFSYSHKDEAVRDELEVHLSMLKRQGIIEPWHDRRIVAGDEFDGQISEHLEAADIILLLVSPYFLASSYCYDVELKRAMEKHQDGTARVLPVIVDPCDWHSAPFGKLLAMPRDGKPISKHPNAHDALLEITKAIRKAATSIEPTTLTVESPPVSVKTISESPRSSNLRVKKTFTQRDRDKFRNDAFEYVANFFEGSLKELEERNETIETEYRRIDANTFTVTIYGGGESRSECAVSLSGSFGGDCITYSSDKSSRGHAFNHMMRVVDDGTQLGFTVAANFGGRNRDEQLTKQGAAESLWAVLMAPLQG